MAWLRRRESPPAEVTALLPPGDRVLAWADVEVDDGGGAVLASTRGLCWPTPEGTARLIAWQFVDKAVWRDGALTVIEAELVDEVFLVDRPPSTVRLSRPRDLPPIVRKRVEANVVRSELLAVPGGAARFVARRVPGQDGVVWWVRLEPGTPRSPEVRTHVREVLALLRDQWATAQA